MERVKRPKQGNKAKKQQPIKVVYITNPMRFKTSASEFRALVQELTGKDSDIADNLAKYSSAEYSGSSSTTDHHHHHQVSIINSADSGQASFDGAGAIGCPMELFDAAFQNFP